MKDLSTVVEVRLQFLFQRAPYPVHENKTVYFLSELEQRRRNARLDNEEFKPLRGTASLTPSPTMLPISGRNLLAFAAEKYFSSCQKRGLSAKDHPQVPGSG